MSPSRTYSGRKSRAVREAAGVPLAQVALTLERSVYTVADYELGRIIPPTSVLPMLADLYGCSIEDFFETDPVAA